MIEPATDAKADGRALDEVERELADRLLCAERDAIEGLRQRLGGPFHQAVGLIVRCADAGHTVHVSGLGKSGLIGAKISATLASLGIPSHPMHPTEAAHGDLGRIKRNDLCLALSYSGETEEVVALAAALRQDGAPVISITRGGENALARVANVALEVGCVDDDKGISPAPMCSTTAMLALGDALALAASRRRRFTDEDFAKRHPGGALGGLLRPVMQALRFTVGKNLVVVDETTPLEQALREAEGPGRRPGALLLVEPMGGRLSGILTDSDLRRLLTSSSFNWDGERKRPVADFMTRNPGALPHTSLVRDAVHMVQQHRRDEIPVVDADGRPVGLLDVQDLITMRVVSE